MNSINKYLLKRKLVEKGIILPIYSLPNHVMDKLSDMLIDDGIIYDSYFISKFGTFSYIYRNCAIDANDEKELDDYFKLIEIYNFISKQGELGIHESNLSLLISNTYNLFYDKKKPFKLLNRLVEVITKEKIVKNELEEYISRINNYLTLSRKYYSDEVIYFSRLISELDTILKSNNIIDDLIKQDKKLAGIYDIDENKIQTLEEKAAVLEKKLEDLEKNADKNSNDYKQIESETKKLLNDISKIKISESKKVFKIAGISKKDERDILLNNVKQYNNNFAFYTSDTRWFCKEVIDKLGIEFIANNCSGSYQISINRAYQNNQINELSQAFKLNPEFRLYNSILLSKEFVELFGIPLIATKFSDCNAQKLVERFYNSNEIILLKKILEINPNFEVSNPDISYINGTIIEELTIEYIANCSNSQHYTISRFFLENELTKLFSILKINPDFYIEKDINNLNISLNSSISIDFLNKNLIKNLNTLELIDFFDLEKLNFCKMYKLADMLYDYDINYPSSKTIADFINLDPSYRQKALNLSDSKLPSPILYNSFKQIVRSNATKSETKRLVKR